MKRAFTTIAAAAVFAIMGLSQVAYSNDLTSSDVQLWLKIRASNKVERSQVEALGASIEITRDDYVIAIGNERQRDALKKLNMLETSFVAGPAMFDFPAKDANFHNYAETKAKLDELVAKYPGVATLDSIGKSIEGREIYHIRISGDLAHADQMPAVIYMGGHHAREHLSIEIPLLLAEKLLDGYANNDPEIRRLVSSRDIHIIPMVNPDGAEYDISNTGSYKMWRKNRAKNNDGTYGVDLNRNYGYGWGTGGSSKRGSDETFMGNAPFSEPETQAIKAFVDRTQNATMLLSFHTFSELVLYPWGGTYDQVADARDHSVFETMAKQMAKWNGYTPQQSSELYIASGDTTDWAYATHKIFAFTFELDPADMWMGGGFYPGQAVIPGVFTKNLKPCLYMLDLADNPYRSIEAPAAHYGLGSPLVH